MRKLIQLIAALLAAAVIASLLLATAASARVDGQTYTATVAPQKQSARTFGGASLTNVIETAYTGFNPSSSGTVIRFSRDLKFVPGNKAQCPLGSIQGKTTAAATATCSSAMVGHGEALINNGALKAAVTAFNGIPTSGPTIYLHADVNDGALITDLTGVLDQKTNTLTVSGPPNTPGTVTTRLSVQINKIKTGKRSFYVMARCKRKRWVSSETTTYIDGSVTSATSVQKCKQKK